MAAGRSFGLSDYSWQSAHVRVFVLVQHSSPYHVTERQLILERQHYWFIHLLDLAGLTDVSLTGGCRSLPFGRPPPPPPQLTKGSLTYIARI